jgi:hypothetical protein
MQRVKNSTQGLPASGPRKPPKKAMNAKYANAVVCVFGVLFSEIIARTVLRYYISANAITSKDITRNLHDGSCKHTSHAAKQYHLKYTLAQSEKTSANSYTG